MPEQFGKFTPQEELANLKPTPLETKEALELSKEQDEHLVDFLQRAKQAEEQGNLEQAIKLYLQYKEEYQVLKEEKETQEKRDDEEKKRNYENYECLKTLEGHEHSVNSVFESKDGREIISGSEDGTIKIWGEKEK